MSHPEDSSETPLCRFVFSDGRHCSTPAHPAFDGLCCSHGTLATCASRQDHLLHELAALQSASSSSQDSSYGFQALSHAVREGRISPHHAAVLLQIGNILKHSERWASEEAFAAGRGPDWDRLRQLLDELDGQPLRTTDS